MSASPIPDRRAFLSYFGSVGLGSTLLPGVLWAKVASGADITTESIAAAAEIAGLEFDETERQQMVEGLRQQARQLAQLHAVPIDNAVPPALVFDPVPPGMTFETARRPLKRAPVTVRPVGRDLEALAFRPVTELSELIRTRQVTSEQLTRMYLDRLKRYDPVLHCVVTLMEERGLEQARAMDRELAAGRYRGPLHGIPWGAKDLLGADGAPTTWGASPYREQQVRDAIVVRRLQEAGAVLVAKLTLGELAMGDVWFGGMTRNPWKLEQGSSGSSAGSASAAAAGLVGFAIGSETLGSISSPSTRCGVTGLRPTFGRVPRTGAMALSWSMDKLGPICRGVEDCALVLDVINGADGLDPAARDVPFNWDGTLDPRTVRVGYFAQDFARDYPQKAFDEASLGTLRRLGITLREVAVPELAYGAMRIILTAEGAAAFDDLTRSGRDSELAQQGPNSWPNTFRTARLIPAADYVNANRLRSVAIQKWAELFRDLDVIVAPTNSTQLVATNLTGHPAVILPNGFREDGTPVSLTFLGSLFGEARMLAVARAYQEATDFHRRTPPLPARVSRDA